MKPRVVLATCRERPALTPGDRLLAAALGDRGAMVEAAPWNGPFAPFRAADLVVVRSTWDYPACADEFAGWLGALGDLEAHVANAPALMRWNLDKSYLLALAAAGVAIAPTQIAAPDPGALDAALSALGLVEGIAKPVIGASAKGLSRISRADAAGLARAARALGGRPALVQPVLAEITTRGETSFVFIGGAFSHAVVKRPRAGSLLVQEKHGGRTERADPPRADLEAAYRALSALPSAPDYARIDGVAADGRLVLMEAELIEPDLFLTHDAAAPARFADVLLRKLKV